MEWRAEAKELNIPLYHRKKKDVLAEIADVLKDIETKKVLDNFNLGKIYQKVKLVVSGKQATRICNVALREYVKQQGLVEPITCEAWYINCKRKGIVFTGAKHDSASENKQTRC